MVFSSLTPHLTGPNTTDAVRKAYILQYAPTGAVVNFAGSWAWAAWPVIRATGLRPSRSATLNLVITIAAAPSEIDEALAAVIVPSLAKAGRSLARDSAVVSPRTPSSVSKTTGSPLRCGTSTATTSSPNVPSAQALAAFWWLAAASWSWASRVMPHVLAVIAMCSPMDRPVRGSVLAGVSMPMSPGRIARRPLAMSAVVLPRLRRSSLRRSFSLTMIGASEDVSTLPAMPDSTWPSLILLETRIAFSSPVPHACWTSYAVVSGARLDPRTASRVRLKSRLCLMTAPPTTSPSRSPARP